VSEPLKFEEDLDLEEDVPASVASPPAQPPSRMEAAGSTAAQGATLGWGDELSSRLRSGLEAVFGGPDDPESDEHGSLERHYATGSKEADMEQNMRQTAEASREEYPVQSFVTEAGGAAAPAGLAARFAPGGAVAQGSVLGGVAGAGYADGDLEDRAAGATAGAALGWAGGKVAPVIADKGGGFANWLAGKMKPIADRRRLAATGARGSQIKNVAGAKGEEGVARIAETLEREGVHRGATPLPQGWQTYADNAAQLVDDAGREIGELSQRATQEGVTIDMRPIAGALLEEAAEMQKLPVPQAHKVAEELLEGAALLERQGSADYATAHALRRFLDDLAWKEERALNSAVAERSRGLADRVRGAMAEAAEQHSPELAQAIQGANRKYEAGMFAAQAGRNRLAQEAGNQVVSLPAMIAGAGGASAGGGPGGMGGVMLAEGMKRRGNAAMAGSARTVQRAAEAVADRAPTVAAPEGPAAAAAAQGAKTSIAGQGADSAAFGEWLGVDSAAQGDSPAETVTASAASDPEYGPAFSSARGSDEQAALYWAAMQDQEFRQRQRDRAAKQGEEQP